MFINHECVCVCCLIAGTPQFHKVLLCYWEIEILALDMNEWEWKWHFASVYLVLACRWKCHWSETKCFRIVSCSHIHRKSFLCIVAKIYSLDAVIILFCRSLAHILTHIWIKHLWIIHLSKSLVPFEITEAASSSFSYYYKVYYYVYSL